MNQQRYRLVFDRTRGMLVAVAEIVTSHGKAAGQTRPGRLRGVEARSFSLRSLTFSLWGMLGLVTLASGATTTQVTVDPSAPAGQQPTLLAAPNGVPLINIQTPSAAGVSRNTYTQFDVGQNGAILNNSRTNVQTQLGGWVQGNPWMAAGTAKVILNEVNSNNPSLLQGYVEVAGDRAQVVIANPAGISCSGCGFINASRATLTTGTAVLNAGGGLDGYRVQGGTITVDGAGLDASTADYTDLIARAVQVNAGIWANQLRVTTGANQVDAGNTSATPILGAGAAPAFGIDVAQLGGMYAGKIVLVGTESGVGVRNAGQIGASAGDVVVTADGQLVNSGRITSSGQTTLQSNSDVTNSGTLYAQGNLTLTSAGTLTNSGFLAAQGDATLSANQIASGSGALLGAGIQSDGTLALSGTLAVTAAQGMASTGQNLAGGDLHLSGATLDLAGSRNQAQNITLAASQGNIDLIGATVAANQSLVALAAQSLLNTNGVLAANGDIAIGAASVDNHQGTVAATLGNLVIGTGALDNSNGILATSDLGGDVVLTAGSLDNTSGQIGSGRDIVLQANSLTGDGRIVSGRDLSLSLPGDYTYTATNLFKANRNMALQFGGAFTNQGALEAVGTLGLAAASLDNQAGADINSAQTVLAVTGNVLNDGRIEGDTLAIQAGDITNDSTLIGSNLALSANTLTNTGSSALIAATNDIQLWIANALTNQGGATIYSLGNLSIGADSQRDANGNLVNNTPTLLNDSSTIESGGNMEIAVDNLTNQRLVQTTQVDQGTTTNVRGNTVLWQWSGSPVTPDDFVPQVTTLSDGTTITSYSSAYYQYWNRALNIRGAYTAPAVVTIDASNIASNDTSGQVVTLNTPLFFGAYNFRIFQWDDYSTPMTNPSSWYASSIYYQSLVPINGGTQYQLTFYPGQTANSLQPSELRSAGMTDCGELWELQRTDVVHTFQDQITQLAAPSRILAGGNLQIGLGGTLSNQQAQIAAGGSIAVNGATTDSGSVSGSNVVNTSVLLNKTQLVSSSSYFWTWSTLNGGENRVANITYPTTTQTTVTGSVDGTITAGQSVSINAGSISNLNVAGSAAPSGGSTAANAFASSGSPTLPSNGLYTLNTSPEQHYLVATDPRFANYSTWLSSDYMLNALALDPATIQKRLGDGFYEQRLVEDQVAQLTGSRYLAGFTSDASEYQALMDAGVTFAKQYDLVPGVALTDTQMAALTSDIVWLVDKTVTLPDGSTQTVLAPQIYLAHTNSGDVRPSGALIAAQNVTLQAADSLTNVGTLKGDTVTLYANDLANKGGTVDGAASVTAIANHDLINDGGTFQGGRIALVAGQDLTFKAGNLAAAGDATLVAGRNIDIGVTTTQASANSRQDGRTSSVTETTNTGSTLTAGHDLTLQSGGDTTITAAKLTAGNSLTAQAQGNLIVQSATDTKSLSYQTSGDHYQYGGSQTDTTVVGSTLTAGHGVNLTAQQGTALIESSKIDGGQGAVGIQAAGDVILAANQDTHQASYSYHHDGGVFGNKDTVQDDTLQTTAQVANLAGDTAGLTAGGNVLLQASQIRGTTIDLQAGTTDPNGQVIFQGVTETTQTSHTEQHSNLLWQAAKGQGSTTQTLKLANIQGHLNLTAPGGILAQLPQGDFKTQLSKLANEPGQDWLNQVAQNPNINWQQIALAHDQWQYDKEGLGPVGALIVAIVVAIATQGAGAGMLDSAAGAGTGTATAATATSAATYTTAGLVANAGFTALATQAGVSLINNKGDLGKTLADLGSSESVKSLIASMLTAGLENIQFVNGKSLNQMANLSNLGNTGKAIASGATGQIGTFIEGVAGRAVVSAGVNSALLGTDFGKAFVGSVVGDLGAVGANQIGTAWGNGQNPVMQTIAHAALGCAEAGLTGGNCSSGAAGAAAESVLGNLVTLPTDGNGYSKTTQALYEASAALIGGIAGQQAGGDAQSGANTALNAAVNNYLGQHPNHAPYTSEQEQYNKALSECMAGSSSACTLATELGKLSQMRDQLLAQACDGSDPGACHTQISKAIDSGNQVITLNKNGIPTVVAYPQDTAFVSTLTDPYYNSTDYALGNNLAQSTPLLTGYGTLSALSSLGLSLKSATTVVSTLGAASNTASYYATTKDPNAEGALIAAGVGGVQGYLNVRSPGEGTIWQGAAISGGGDVLTQYLNLAASGKNINQNFNWGELIAATGSGAIITKFTGPSVLNVRPTWGEQTSISTVTWPFTTSVTAIGQALGNPDTTTNVSTQGH